jgi:hypothetical protein
MATIELSKKVKLSKPAISPIGKKRSENRTRAWIMPH